MLSHLNWSNKRQEKKYKKRKRASLECFLFANNPKGKIADEFFDLTYKNYKLFDMIFVDTRTRSNFT